jgi:hypothetical protein
MRLIFFKASQSKPRNPLNFERRSIQSDRSKICHGLQDSEDIADRKHFIIFIPSRRNIEFLQKNITQFNVEFMLAKVIAQNLSNRAFRWFEIASIDCRTEYITIGKAQTKKQPTTIAHVEIFLKYILRLLQPS